MQSCKLYRYTWKDICTKLNTVSFVDKYLHLDQYRNEIIYKQLCNAMEYEVIEVKQYCGNYAKMSNDVSGVGFPQNVRLPDLKPSILGCPKNGIGIIKLPRGNDFIVIEKSNFNKSSIMEMCLNEMKIISSGLKSPRAGAAGGFMLPHLKSSNLSKVTENERLMTIRKNSVAMSVSYRNSDGKVKGYNSVYTDLFMRRLTSKQKFKEALKNIGYQRVLISEMISRLRTFMLLHHLGIAPIHNTLFTFLCYSKDRIKMEQEFMKKGRSELQAKLLSWACSTGEMRNHQAVKAHYDGNKSHSVETYTLFGRLSVNLRNMTVGLLHG